MNAVYGSPLLVTGSGVSATMVVDGRQPQVAVQIAAERTYYIFNGQSFQGPIYGQAWGTGRI